MIQSDLSAAASIDRQPDEADSITGLLSLLVDLEIIEPSKSSANPNSVVENNSPVHSPDSLDSSVGKGFVSEDIVTSEDSEPFQAIVPVSSSNSSSVLSSDLSFDLPKSSATEFNETLETDALEQLQALLVKPELEEFRPWLAAIEQKLTNVEHQIYDPAALIKLLLPRIAELLNRKIAESHEDVVQAIAPIIDQIIHSRSEQNKAAMSAALSPLIAAAIAQQHSQSPEELANAIAPLMGQAIKTQIKLEQDAMVDALYPIIGSTIAKYLAEAIETINQKIENTFSLEGIQRKIRARLQGVSEAELILREAIPFTVQAVFLIHKASGLIMAEAQPVEHWLEAEMVAGMLTAIRSFANDCVAGSRPTSDLNAIDYGDAKILLEVAGYCYLAAVVQGEVPRSFVAHMRQFLSSAVQQYSSAIEQFNGDPETVPQTILQQLEALRTIDLPQDSKTANKPPFLLISGLAVLSFVTVTWAVMGDRSSISRQVAAFAIPDWLIQHKIQGVEVLPDSILASAEVQRVTALLNQLHGIGITSRYVDRQVFLAGTVGRAAHLRIVTQAFEQIPGVQSVSSAIEIQPLQIEVRFYFDVASAQIVPMDYGNKLQAIVQYLAQHPEQQLRITGYANAIDSPDENPLLAAARAKAVRDALIDQGIHPDRLQTVGATGYPPGIGIDQPTWLSRCVDFQPLSPD